MRGSGWFADYAGEYRRTWWERLVSVLLLTPVLWLSVLLLRVPAGSALTVPALLIDRLIVASTAVVLPVATLLLLILPAPGARAAAIAGATVSGIVGLPTALAAIDAPRKILPTALALGSVICGATLLLILLSTSLKGRGWRLSLLAPLALLPVIQFWQETDHTPSQLITSVTPHIHVATQRADAEASHGVIEITLANPADVRASLFSSQIIYCFVTAQRWEEIDGLRNDDLLDNENCRYDQLLVRNAHVDAGTTQIYAIPWRVPADRSFATVVMRSQYAREDRVRFAGTPTHQESAQGCQGPVTVHRLETDTRFRGVVQPARRLTFDDDSFYLSYEGAPLCTAKEDDELQAELGVRSISIRRGDWLADTLRQE
jgi:hypothetical protein